MKTAIILATLIASVPLKAQKIDIYLGPTNPPTVTMADADTITLTARVYNSVGSKMSKFGVVTWDVNSHCLGGGSVVDSTGKIVNGTQWFARPGCVVPTGYIVAKVTVNNITVKDSVQIVPIPASPAPAASTPLAICLAGASYAVTSSANGWAVVLAVDAFDRRVPLTQNVLLAMPQLPVFPINTTMQVQYYAYMCGPGYQAFEFGKNSRAKWTSSNSIAASVNTTGLVTIKKPTGWGISADYRWP